MGRSQESEDGRKNNKVLAKIAKAAKGKWTM